MFAFCVNSYLLLGFFEYPYNTPNSKASFIFSMMITFFFLQLILLFLFPKSYFNITDVGAFNVAIYVFTLSIIAGFDEVLRGWLGQETLVSMENPTYSIILIVGVIIGYLFVNLKKLQETRLINAKLVMEYLEEKYSPITKRNFALINFAVILFSTLPFLIYLRQSTWNIIPEWIIYLHFSIIGVWQGIWFFLITNEDELLPKFKQLLLLIDRIGTVAIITLSFVTLLYYLEVIQNIGIFLQRIIPVFSKTLINLLSWLINTIISGIIGNWAYDKIKFVKISAIKNEKKQQKKKKEKKA
jgi:hypothetical protein